MINASPESGEFLSSEVFKYRLYLLHWERDSDILWMVGLDGL